MDEENVHHLTYEDKNVTLVGTAHVSRESAELVDRLIRDEKPETVCLELCRSRYESLTHPERCRNMSLLTAIKEKEPHLFLSTVVLSYFQKKIGEKLGVEPGAEMLKAAQAAEMVGARIHLVDREVRVTLSRAWRLMSFRSKIRLLGELTSSVGELDSIKEEDIENLKKKDMLEAILEEVDASLPELRTVLIDEVDQYLAHKIRTAPGNRIVAVVGAGHIPGILKYWEQPIETESLERIPPKA